MRSKSVERSLFEILLNGDETEIDKSIFIEALKKSGLQQGDPRLSECMKELKKLGTSNRITFEQFKHIIRRNVLLIEQALSGTFVIPDFTDLTDDILNIFESTKSNHSGEVATYIPQLSRIRPEQYGVALCTVDGQRFEIGDHSTDFCVQSCCKPINYCLALEEQGEEKVHQHIGREPSGHGFNTLTLNKDGLPHNPMINAGAIMACSLIKPELHLADRFDHVLNTWKRLSGGVKAGFSNSTYLSERETSDRNFALAYFMSDHKAFPGNTDIVSVLEFYFQCCSLEMSAKSMSAVAATFANGGICPITGERVLQPDTVQKCLSLMYSCGMYDFSGEWAFSIGLPAKSGVAGAVMVVIPNVMGLCIWSPRLDSQGNSVRAVQFSRKLVERYNFHNYDSLDGGRHNKKDPRLQYRQTTNKDLFMALCWSASEGDLTAIFRLTVKGANLSEGDYDDRTPLHLAASEGHSHIVRYIIAQGVNVNPKDRWGNTPLDDAIREHHKDTIVFLEKNGAVQG